MRNKPGSRHATTHELPRNPHDQAILEFVLNDEEDALCGEEFALSHQRAMPALQEFLEHMHETGDRGPF
jgi:hypothetical protein